MKLTDTQKTGVAVVMLMLAVFACSRPGTQQVVYVTATFPGGERVVSESPTPDEPTETPIIPTPNPSRDVVTEAIQGSTYTVKAGDTLAVIAAAAGVTLEAIMQANGI